MFLLLVFEEKEEEEAVPVSEQQRPDGDDGAEAHRLGEDHPQHVHPQQEQVLPAAGPLLVRVLLCLVEER